VYSNTMTVSEQSAIIICTICAALFSNLALLLLSNKRSAVTNQHNSFSVWKIYRKTKPAMHKDM
jgi:hypothetical protein